MVTESGARQRLFTFLGCFLFIFNPLAGCIFLIRSFGWMVFNAGIRVYTHEMSHVFFPCPD